MHLSYLYFLGVGLAIDAGVVDDIGLDLEVLGILDIDGVGVTGLDGASVRGLDGQVIQGAVTPVDEQEDELTVGIQGAQSGQVEPHRDDIALVGHELAALGLGTHQVREGQLVGCGVHQFEGRGEQDRFQCGHGVGDGGRDGVVAPLGIGVFDGYTAVRQERSVSHVPVNAEIWSVQGADNRLDPEVVLHSGGDAGVALDAHVGHIGVLVDGNLQGDVLCLGAHQIIDDHHDGLEIIGVVGCKVGGDGDIHRDGPGA